MTRRGGYVVLAASTVIFCLCAGLIVWRLTARRTNEQAPPAAIAPNKPAEIPANARSTSKISTIIDLPGDPVLVRRGVVSPPKELPIAVPAKLGLDAPKSPAQAYFIDSALISTTGGYMGKFPEAGQEADALALQLAENSEPGRRRPNSSPDRGRLGRRWRRGHAGGRSKPSPDNRQQQPARGQFGRIAGPAATQGDDPQAADRGKDKRFADRQRLQRGKRANDRKRSQGFVGSHSNAAAAKRRVGGGRT